MSSLANDDDQLEMFRHDGATSGQDRVRPTSAAARLTERDIAELAEIVARRVVAALPSDENAGAPAREAAPGPPAGGLMTAGEIAARLGVKPGWIYRQSRAGRIPTVKLGRYYRYRLDAIEAWLAERERAA
jgi:excisionase family DNA binding protein